MTIHRALPLAVPCLHGGGKWNPVFHHLPCNATPKVLLNKFLLGAQGKIQISSVCASVCHVSQGYFKENH